MSDEPTGRTEEEEEATPLADDELDEVAGGKILNRGNRHAAVDNDGEELIKD